MEKKKTDIGSTQTQPKLRSALLIVKHFWSIDIDQLSNFSVNCYTCWWTVGYVLCIWNQVYSIAKVEFKLCIWNQVYSIAKVEFKWRCS